VIFQSSLGLQYTWQERNTAISRQDEELFLVRDLALWISL
jgi:hypothetical protein